MSLKECKIKVSYFNPVSNKYELITDEKITASVSNVHYIEIDSSSLLSGLYLIEVESLLATGIQEDGFGLQNDLKTVHMYEYYLER